MSDENPKILGTWECDVCVVPQYWAPRGSIKPMDESMRKLLIVDVTPEERAIALADEAERAAIETAKENARQERLKKKPMSEETKAALRELAESKKAMKNAIKAQFNTEEHPEARLLKSKLSKIPVFQDLQKQAEICAKFAWVVPGSFTQDPEKSGGTLLAIKCGSCGDERIIHLADAFHCKMCKECKKTNGKSKKLGGQSTGGPDSSEGSVGDPK